MREFMDILEENDADDVVQRAAYALEKYTMSAYGWSDEEFDVWFYKDPSFVSRKTTMANGFHGTRKEYLFEQVRVVLEAARQPQ